MEITMKNKIYGACFFAWAFMGSYIFLLLASGGI